MGKEIYAEETRNYAVERKKNYFNKDWKFEDAENYFAVDVRLKETLSMIHGRKENSLVLVSHGNFLRHLVARLLLQEMDGVDENKLLYQGVHVMSNVGITEFVWENNAWNLIHYNDHAHFAE